MSFCQVQFFFVLIVFAIYLILDITKSISDRFDKKGLNVASPHLRMLLWIRKGEMYVSYVSLIFVVIGYVYAMALVPCYVVCLFVSLEIATKIVCIYAVVTMGTFMVEVWFLPFYGLKGL